MTPKWIPLAVLSLLLFPSNLCAQMSQAKNGPTLRTVVRKGSETTYFDLLRMILPDLQFDPNDSDSATAHRIVPVRHISDDETGSLEGNFSITSFETHWIMSDGRQIVLLNLDLTADGANEGTPFEGETSLLAAFGLDPTPKLLDVMDMKLDRFTSFWEEQPTFQLNSQHGAFVVHNTHWNAGESYNDLQVFFLDGGRFKTITSLFLFNTQGCAATFTETPSFRALPDGRKYPKIIVKVKLTKEADTKECDRRTPAYTKYYQAVFYWNGAKAEYQTSSRQLNALDKFNRDRM